MTKLVTGAVSTPNINQMDGYGVLSAIFARSFKIGPVTVWTHRHLVVRLRRALAPRSCSAPSSATGSTPSAATPRQRRAVGVPVTTVKVGLFMGVAFLGWFVGMHLLYRFNTLQAGNGVGNEFLYIIAAVVGGTLLTGGYGNAIGVAIGAFIFGMTSLCIVYAGWDPNWFKAFLGVMLLLAVIVNLYVKKLSTTRKVG